MIISLPLLKKSCAFVSFIERNIIFTQKYAKMLNEKVEGVPSAPPPLSFLP